ncbi:FKBP-type peptidyl-prolyl cis-trans isomerase [Acinetobacter sp. HY1485]|uniref:FKBP-type peptidyl-prolyl cis-trans isomerase n=1 Tax=Acinetobacter sp. HY1485 TaxID=2970918 RepID=UPI0022B97878|nr:FKBP-type peptidyl-prolyl cis-trans isomerase [Acinetobacter sp. HY1485]
MKKCLALFCSVTCLSSALWAAPTINAQSSLSDQAGYSLGYLLAKNNADAMRGLDLDAFIQGIVTASQQKQPVLSEQQMKQAIGTYRQQAENQEFIKLQQQAKKNSDAERIFLSQNAKKPDIKTLASGVQYTVLQMGKGITPQPNSNVTINYEGRLIDGTVFDSSIARQQEVNVNMSDLVLGLQQGLATMKEGGKTRFFIPAKFGYGEIGTGDVIEPNSTLIFDVELIKVNK